MGNESLCQSELSDIILKTVNDEVLQKEGLFVSSELSDNNTRKYDVGNESLCQSELSDIIEYDVGNESLCQPELSDIIEYDVGNESLCQSRAVRYYRV